MAQDKLAPTDPRDQTQKSLPNQQRQVSVMEVAELGTPDLGLTTASRFDALSALPVDSPPVHYDKNLLDRARTQWQFGDWHTLVQLNPDSLQHHPDRAELALLAAAGRLQADQIDEARQCIRLAEDWGVSKNLIIRILAAGVHNSLGRAAAISGDQPSALQHFEAAIQTGTPGSDHRLLTQARINEQFIQLGLSPSQLGNLSV